ncbi:hypothetical protein AYI68_g1102 [Smittium mucronatum]|uniref:SUN domain-containing protein n=1 Tax=Smittium mucronatum TaxID=133383 RepID=A0A1R0H6C8_9FUNG|nr:hypothetical protein AYI68_g1102 [Smittium mucronatum]
MRSTLYNILFVLGVLGPVWALDDLLLIHTRAHDRDLANTQPRALNSLSTTPIPSTVAPTHKKFQSELLSTVKVFQDPTTVAVPSLEPLLSHPQHNHDVQVPESSLEAKVDFFPKDFSRIGSEQVCLDTSIALFFFQKTIECSVGEFPSINSLVRQNLQSSYSAARQKTSQMFSSDFKKIIQPSTIMKIDSSKLLPKSSTYILLGTPTKTVNTFKTSMYTTSPAHERPTSTPSKDSIPKPTNFGKFSPNMKVPLKDRFNYASVDCGSSVLNSNKESRKAKSILSNTKDSYMLNICSAKSKFVTVELCQDILIDTFVLANYEFFSSTFKTIKISVSDRYPPRENNWVNLGTFDAKNTRSDQIFKITEPKLWAKYVRLDVIDHYGSQFYCPISKFSIYGTTQMEKYRYEAEQEELINSKNKNIPAKVKPINRRVNGQFASTLYSYINDFEKVLLGINPAQIPRNDRLIGFPTDHDLYWLTSNTISHNHQTPSSDNKPVIHPAHTKTAGPKKLSNLVNKITSLNYNEDSDSSFYNQNNFEYTAESSSKSSTESAGLLNPILTENYKTTPTDSSSKQFILNSDQDYVEDSQNKVNPNQASEIDSGTFEEKNLAKHRFDPNENSGQKIPGHVESENDIKSEAFNGEEIWRTILFDVESYRQTNNEKIESLGKRIDVIASEADQYVASSFIVFSSGDLSSQQVYSQRKEKRAKGKDEGKGDFKGASSYTTPSVNS